ncbi:MAG: hypothetical protein AD073_000107 [Mycoplasmataceae bacterium]|nr:MAG: hypothetical protein AD073_000107 [Mycoplasmataceae bacterium]
MKKSQSETTLQNKRFRVKSQNGNKDSLDVDFSNICIEATPIKEGSSSNENNDNGELENKISIRKLKYTFESVFYESFESNDGTIYKTSYNGLFWVSLLALFSNLFWISCLLFSNSKINEEVE